MSTLIIRVPPRAAAEPAASLAAVPCAFALTGNAPQAAPTREGVEPLSALAGLIRAAQRVVLLLAASDVTLLRVAVPPMSAARLKAALPNLVEDQLIDDPSQSVIVAAPGNQPERLVAVVQRAWLDAWMALLAQAGARKVEAVPSQLCLPEQEGRATASAWHWGSDADLALRMADGQGIGLPIAGDGNALPDQVLASLLAVVPGGAVTLAVPAAARQAYDQSLAALREAGAEAAAGIVLDTDSWHRWAAALVRAPLDLVHGLGAASGPRIDWKRFRWPVTLAAVFLIVNAVGLNIDWWRMRAEANTLRATQTQIFRTAFPNEPVILDPVAQMRRHIADARRAAGQTSPDDFSALVGGFGEAWNTTFANGATAAATQASAPGTAPAVAGLDYKDHTLLVKIKGDASPDRLRSALASRQLTLSVADADKASGATAGPVWQIRSTR